MYLLLWSIWNLAGILVYGLISLFEEHKNSVIVFALALWRKQICRNISFLSFSSPFLLILVFFFHGCVSHVHLSPGFGNIWFPTSPSLFRVAFAAGIFYFLFFPQCCVIEFCEFSPPADLIPLVLPCRAWLELRNVWDGNWNHPGFTRTWSLEFSSQSKNYINPAQCEGNKQDLKPRSVQNLNGADREVIPKLSREMGAVCSEGCVRNCWIFVFSECSGQNTQVPDCPGIQIPDILSYIYKYLEI